MQFLQFDHIGGKVISASGMVDVVVGDENNGGLQTMRAHEHILDLPTVCASLERPDGAGYKLS